MRTTLGRAGARARRVEVDLAPAAGQDGADGDERIGRSAFLRRAVVLGGALAGGELVLNGLPVLSASRPSARQDAKVFGYVLMLEQLQAAFYQAVLDADVLRGEQLQFAKLVGEQERKHVAYVEQALGSAAKPAPEFRFGDDATTADGFLAATVGIEELGLAAYQGQITNLTGGALRSAGRIFSVEARHVAWARSLAGDDPAPDASDTGLGQAAVMSRVRKRGYVR